MTPKLVWVKLKTFKRSKIYLSWSQKDLSCFKLQLVIKLVLKPFPTYNSTKILRGHNSKHSKKTTNAHDLNCSFVKNFDIIMLSFVLFKRNFNYEIWLFRMMNLLSKEDFCIYVDNHEKSLLTKSKLKII
jgi:hypothetical protein